MGQSLDLRAELRDVAVTICVSVRGRPIDNDAEDADADRFEPFDRGIDERQLAHFAQDRQDDAVGVLADEQRIDHRQQGGGVDDDVFILLAQRFQEGRQPSAGQSRRR
jgi:hypothetical protein